MKKRWIKKVTAYVSATAVAVSALPAAAIPVLADEESTAEVDLNSKITFAGSENYGGPSTDAFKAVAQTKDGGFVAVGYTLGLSTDPVWGYTPTGTGTAKNDGLVVKFNSEMGVEWAQNYGGTGVDVLFDVAVLDNGTIVAVGQSYLAEQVGNAKNASGWVLMIDPDDPGLYTEFFPGGSKGDYMYGVEAMEDNEFVIFGKSASTDAGDWENPSGKTCGIVISYDAEREINWAAVNNIGYMAGLETLKSSGFNGGCVDENGDIVAVGRIQIGKSLYPSQIVKFDGATGEMIWGRLVGTTRTENPDDLSERHGSELSAVTALSDGSYAAIGFSHNDTNEGCDFVTEEQLAGIGAQDSIIVRYDTDGNFMHGETVGTLANVVDFTGICSTDDGGYFVYGSSGSEIIEDYERERGYTFDNAGAHDFLLIKYDADNNCVWSESYGSEYGDYINDLVIAENGQVVGVGEANGESSDPVYGNNGLGDATAFATFAFGSSEQSVDDSENVVWADGVYEDAANGYGGLVTVKVTVTDHRIASVEEVSQSETKSYYKKASALYTTIAESNTWDVDSVSGATLSSNGIKKAAKKALSQAAAATVVALIDEAVTPEYDEAKAAAALLAYEELGTYARTFVTNYDALSGVTSDEPELVGTAPSVCDEENALGAPYEHKEFGFEDEEAEAVEENSFYDGENADLSGGSSDAELSDTYYPYQKAYLDAVGVSTFWERNLGGSGVTLAVIDSGFTPAHQDIDYTNVLPATDCTSGTAVDGGMSDSNRHGTGVLGELIAIRDNDIGIAGLLDDVMIAPIKVTAKKGLLDETSTDDEAYQKAESVTTDISAAIRAAVDKYNAQVITMSLGSTAYNTDNLREAVEYAASNNVLIIASAGNNGTSDLVYPAAFDNVIGVGYCDADLTISATSEQNESVDVVAPGVNMILTFPSTMTKCAVSSGSSFAAPMVAAMAAAAKQMNPDITHDQFLELLKETSTDLGDEGYDTTYGNGVVNFDAFAKKITFSDVLDPDAWYYGPVYWAYNNGITAGYGEGTFSPSAKLTRAQTVTFLYNLAERPDVSGLELPFSDVKEDTWYTDAVKWAYANSVTSGYGAGTFRPDVQCTRAMIVTFIANYAKNVAGNYEEPEEESSFTDVKSTDWFKTSVDWAVANKITSGYGAGTFQPNVTCNRAMMVTFLRNYSNIGAEES